MTERDRTPNPLQDARYSTAMTAGLGLFDTAGWAPPAPGMYAGFGDDGVALAAQFDGRRDYGPKGCAGVVLGGSFLLLCLTLFVLKLVGVIA